MKSKKPYSSKNLKKNKDILVDSSKVPLLSGPSDNNEHAVVLLSPLQQYFINVKKYQLLTPEEELKLTTKYYETKDPEAAYRLITSNLRLVIKIAMDFQKTWMQNLLDLIQEGNIGLMQAVKKFDPYRGFKFSYYSSFWIKAYIIKFIMDNWKLVKIGTTQAQRKLFFNLQKEKDKLEASGYTAEPKLLAQSLGVKESDIIEMDQRLGTWELSLDAPITSDSPNDYKSFLPDQSQSIEDKLAEQELKGLLKEKLSIFRETLNEKEKGIFDKRLLSEKPLTLREIGLEFSVSRERIRQIESRLLKKLKIFLEEQIEDISSLKYIFNLK